MKQAYGINAAGQAVGVGVVGGMNVPFRWTAGTTVALETVSYNPVNAGGAYEFAYAINAAGDVVGTRNDFYGTAGRLHQFLRLRHQPVGANRR